MFVKLHPGDVVAHALDLPAWQRGAEHGQICLPAGAGEGRCHVLLLARRVGDAQDLRDNWFEEERTWFMRCSERIGGLKLLTNKCFWFIPYQHVFCQPALLLGDTRGNAQSKALLPQQGVSSVTTTE